MRCRALHRLALVALAASFVASCGYTTQSMLPEGVDRVQIDVFGNETFYREIEFQLTRDLNSEIRNRTPWVVTRGADADAVLSGRILSVQRPTLVQTDDDLVSEQAVIVSAEVTLRDARDGRLLEKFIAINRAEFIVERGETLETAFDEALRDLAQAIVDKLESRSFLREMGITPKDPLDTSESMLESPAP